MLPHHAPTPQPPRPGVRIGVGKPPSKERGADHVLGPPSKREREELAIIVEEAADAVECILSDGVAEAQNRFNR